MKNRTLILVGLFLFCISNFFFGADYKKAVIDFQQWFDEGNQYDTKNFIDFQDTVRQYITRRSDMDFIDHSRAESAKKEIAFQQSDWADAKKTAQLGKSLNADYIIIVEWYKYFYSVNFLDVNTFQVTTFCENIKNPIFGKPKPKHIKKLTNFKINNN